MDWKLVFGFVLSLLSLGAYIAGLASPYWLYVSVDGEGWYEGLWDVCNSKQCIPFEDAASSSLRTTQAIEVLGLILGVLATICATLKLTLVKEQTRLIITAGILMISAGLLMVVGTMIYATKVRGERDASGAHVFHAGFGLAFAGGATAIIAGVVFFLADKFHAAYTDIQTNRTTSEQ